MAIVAEFAFYLLMEVLMYGLGRCLIPIITLGRARAANAKEIFASSARVYAEKDGKLVFSEMASAMTGVLFLSLLLPLYLAFRG
jgi:hypothetical protein